MTGTVYFNSSCFFFGNFLGFAPIVYFALLLNSERISIVSKNKGGIIKMKAKKGLAAAITAVSVAAATVISAGAIGLGASGSMTEFYFAGDEEIEIALEEQITLASGSKVTLSAFLDEDAFDEEGVYTFYAQPVDASNIAGAIRTLTKGSMRFYDVVDIGFLNEKGNNVSTSCLFTFKYVDEVPDSSYNCAFVCEDDGLRQIPFERVSNDSFSVWAPHCSRFILARVEVVATSTAPEYSRPTYTGIPEVSGWSYDEYSIPEEDIGPPIVSYPEEIEGNTESQLSASDDESQNGNTESQISASDDESQNGNTEQISQNKTPDPSDKGANTGDDRILTIVFAAVAISSVGIALFAGRKKSES